MVSAKYNMDEQRACDITRSLLNWYDQNKRDLPWRHSQEPYGIWISEIMAQQTRITALLPYYRRFMKQFPTVEALAAADESEVLKAWEGLGYYARAKNLQKAAQIIVSFFSGEIPSSLEELIALPGIGEYTAGAILSIAFGLPFPAVDGNVLRVYSRVEKSELDIALPPAKASAKQFISSLMPSERTGSFTQALMELGALICVPRTPLCEACPLAELCCARLEGLTGELPVKSAKKPPKSEDKTILVICGPDGQILVRQRTEKLLSGLWEFYSKDGRMDLLQTEAHLQALGFTVSEINPMGKAEHVFTHIIWHMEGFFCHVTEQHVPEGYLWKHKSELRQLALPSAIRYYTKAVLSTEDDQ